jgi:hypothetical protein
MSHEFFSGQSYWCICDGSRIPLRTELLVYLWGFTKSSLDRVIGVSLRSHEVLSGQSYWCISEVSRSPLWTELCVYLGGATNSSLGRVIGVSLRFHEVLSGQRYKCICDGLRIPLWIELLAYLWGFTKSSGQNYECICDVSRILLYRGIGVSVMVYEFLFRQSICEVSMNSSLERVMCISVRFQEFMDSVIDVFLYLRGFTELHVCLWGFLISHSYKTLVKYQGLIASG